MYVEYPPKPSPVSYTYITPAINSPTKY